MKFINVGLFFVFASIILGALGAHAFEKILDSDRLDSFKTATNYLMLNGLGILILTSLRQKFSENIFKYSLRLIICGTLLFSLSIYFLIFLNQAEYFNFNRILGPLTPIGGVSMISGWALLFINSFQQNV